MFEQRPPASQKPTSTGPTQNPTQMKAHACTQGSTLLPHRRCHEHRLGPRIAVGPGAEQAASVRGLRGAFPLLPSPSQHDLLALAGNTSSLALLQIRLVASWEWIRPRNSTAATEACKDQRYSSSAFNPPIFNRKRASKKLLSPSLGLHLGVFLARPTKRNENVMGTPVVFSPAVQRLT